MLIPEVGLIKSTWRDYATGYSGSYIHEACNNISNSLKKVLSDHLINRNVLLGRIVNWGYTNDSLWTTAYATLPSVGQLTGTFASHNNEHDDGEANYKLPLFDHMSISTGQIYWTRGVSSNDSGYCINEEGIVSEHLFTTNNLVRPTIYIR